ncbi:cadherin-related tumor suppressor-like [Mercenaria mercenaria]|uniref:cadherin-related tumor suppressor-like n=1 Tax=Mercenaria mercenaria TaxID=6596 RepID=UPI00234F14AE|nr:cadherin-related tumor suppressor-like [Mercenaria mercenaria]
MCRMLFYMLAAALVSVYGTDAYTVKTLNCSDNPTTNIQNLIGVDDKLKRGQTLFLTNEVVTAGSNCPSRDILNISSRTDDVNGSIVTLNTDLGSYCEQDNLNCNFDCIDTQVPDTQTGIIVLSTIARIQEYNLVFEEFNYTATVSENAEIGSTVHINKNLNIRITNCSAGTTIPGYFGRFSLGKASNDSGHFEWQAETMSNSLHVSGLIDYETRKKYQLTVEARLADSSNNKLNGTAIATLTVTVMDVDDNNPKFNISELDVYQLKIPEHNKSYVDVSLKTTPPVHAYDPDYGLNMDISYSILVQEEPGLFEIENDGSIKVSRRLDYEEKSEYRILIKAAQTDRPDTASAVATLEVYVIDIDDHLPKFTKDPYTCNISEHSVVGSVICIVTAIDNDTTPENSNFTYFVLDASPQVSVNNNGKLTVKNSTTLDRETTGGKLTLKVGTRTMSGADGGNATVIINLADINDNNPAFDRDMYSFTGNATVGFVVGQVKATDFDEGRNAEITYSILPPVASSSCIGNLPSTPLFSVNSSTGEITVDDIAIAFCKLFVLNIKACDTGVNSRCNFTTVEISIPESNETKTNATQTLTVLEELPKGTAIDFVKCSAADHSYEYHGGPEFEIDTNTGMIKTKKVLDRETNDSYNFIVDVKISSVLLCTVNISVTVGDVNDNSPVFNETSYQFTLPASPKDGELLGTIGAVDIDLYENGNVSYFLEDQSNSPFLLGQLSGELTIKQADRLNEDIMQVYVKAIDNGKPLRQNSTIIYIVGEASHNMVPISTPLAVEGINGQKTEFERKISKILNITIEIGKVEEVTNKSSPYKTRIHLSTSKNSTVSRQSFLSQVLAHYEDIRSLFYQSSEDTGTEEHSAIGPSEIGLIVMAGVILAGAILAIFIVHRQFSSQKRYKQLYDSLTKNSSLYESQEITVNIPDDGPDCNGTVQNQDFNQNDTSNSPSLATSAVNPVYQSETDVTTVVENTHANDYVSDDPKDDNTEVKTALRQLTDSYEQEDGNADKINDPDDEGNETVPPVVYANVSSLEERGNHDYVNTNVVCAQIESVPEQDGETETDASLSRNQDLITFDSESNGDTNEQMDDDNESKSPTDDTSEEPKPDYNEKQVRFHSEVLDADENKLEPLKVKNEDSEAMESPEVSATTDAETTDGDLAVDAKYNGDTPIIEPDSDTQLNMSIDKDEESSHISVEEDSDRLEEEIESPQVPYIENIQDEFYFGDMESTHF